jgi:hypothetical protein
VPAPANAGILLNLSTVQTWNAGFDDNTSGASQHYAYANGGTINLSGSSAPSPCSAEDYLRFIADSNGTILLPNLQSVSSANAGHTRFEIADPPRAPALASADRRSSTSTAAAPSPPRAAPHQLLLRWLPETRQILRATNAGSPEPVHRPDLERRLRR